MVTKGHHVSKGSLHYSVNITSDAYIQNWQEYYILQMVGQPVCPLIPSSDHCLSFGVASYWTVGHVSLSTSNCLIFQVIAASTKSDIRLRVTAYPVKTV